MSANKNLILDANEKPKFGKLFALSFQHVFAMFSATVLVPILTGLSISVALFASGVGTLIYILCTKAKVPIYLGSSFAYISYIGAASATSGGIGAALTGLVVVGVIYIIVAIIIKFVGVKWLNKLLPPIVIGPTIMVIGLGLAGSAVGNAGFFAGDTTYPSFETVKQESIEQSTLDNFAGTWVGENSDGGIVTFVFDGDGTGTVNGNEITYTVSEGTLTLTYKDTIQYTLSGDPTTGKLTVAPKDANSTYDWRNLIVAISTMLIIAFISIKAKGFFKVIPFLLGIVAGYIVAVIVGFIPNGNFGSIIDYAAIKEVVTHPKDWFKLPNFVLLGWKDAELGAGISMAKISFSAAISVIPLAFVTICEHIGDHKVLGSITGKDYLVDPGLHRTLLGDGIATAFAGCIGGPANTSYGENTSVVGITKVGSVWVTGGAAVIAILLSFCNVFIVLIHSIPQAVMGGVCLILYGFIASNGLRTLIDAKVDMSNIRNLIIVSVMLVIGLGSAVLKITDDIQFSGMALATVFGILLNAILPKTFSKDVEKI